MIHRLAIWIGALLLTTILCGLVYASCQHILRIEANDPQIQLSEDTASSIAAGITSPDITFITPIDISKSLAPFLIVYDDTGRVLQSSGILDGVTPSVPPGVLAYSKEHGQNRLTWQPRPGIRVAIVVTHINGGKGGYVLAGRSLWEVERREDQLLFFTTCAWAASLSVISIRYLLSSKSRSKRS